MRAAAGFLPAVARASVDSSPATSDSVERAGGAKVPVFRSPELKFASTLFQSLVPVTGDDYNGLLKLYDAEKGKQPKFDIGLISEPTWEGVLDNSNELLKSYDGAIGVKTGNTREAGHCLVAAAQRGDKPLIAVILGSQEKHVWQDAKKLLDYGFKNSTDAAPGGRPLTVR